MPSPAQEAHAQEMQKKFGPYEAAMLVDAPPHILYTHHVMGVGRKHAELGPINAVSHNHHNARPVLEQLVNHALFAMRACVQQEAVNAEEAKWHDPERKVGELQYHHLIALLLDDVSARIADGDYKAAADAVDSFLSTAIKLAAAYSERIANATHGAASTSFMFLSDGVRVAPTDAQGPLGAQD